MKLLLFLILMANISFASNTGSDKDFDGAQMAIPKQKVKKLDDTRFADSYLDYSEFQDSLDEERKNAEAFYYLGRMLALGFDIGVAGFTLGYSQMYSIGPRFGIRTTYFFGISLAMEASLHYQSHNFDILSSDYINGWTGSASIIDVAVAAKYYFDTRSWSAFLTWLHPHVYGGLSYKTITVSAPYGPSEPASNLKVYTINEQVYTFVPGFGFEIRLFTNSYLGLGFKYHWGLYPDENLAVIGNPIDYSFTGDMWTFDTSIVLYF